jgi:hypothetical protein
MTENRIPFNVNQYVWVRITPHGRAVMLQNELRIWPDGCPYKWERTTDERGFTRWQLWELMHEFGRSMGNGLPVPFETEIEFQRETA